jgi:alpha-tubulin suppressor-like RCC1 family protein
MDADALLSLLPKDFGDHIFKYVAPPDAGHLEIAFPRDLVFVEAGAGEALLRLVVARRHAEAVKAGASMLVPLGEGRAGRVTWATELRWVRMAIARLQVGAKNAISAVGSHSLVTTAGEVSSFGTGMLGHGDSHEIEVLPRLVEALSHVVVVQVVASSYHCMVLTSEGLVWTWGPGDCGMLGHGNTDGQLVPKRVGGLTNMTDIAAGFWHSLAVREGGAVYTWGCNDNGQLGLGDHGAGTNRLVPTEVQGVNGVVNVAAGFYHSLALDRDGTVMACGNNGQGQLGLGDTVRRDTFTVVPSLSDVVDIDAGDDHTIAVTCEGEVWTWGKGPATGHGVSDDETHLVPTKVNGGGIEEATVVQVAAGTYHSMALTATGGLYSWGKGTNGQLGHGDTENLAVPRAVDGIGVVVSMSAGAGHSLVITGEGDMLEFPCERNPVFFI